MAGLTGYMELQHEVERVAPSTALVTNHFTGEVRSCRTYRSGDMSCHAVDVEPRSWVLALIPFWPAREDLGGRAHLAERWADDTPFTQTQFFSDLMANGPIWIVMLGLGVLIMRIKDEPDGGGADGGCDGGGAGAGGE